MKPPAGDLPDAVAALFPVERRELVQRYADMLATAGVERGLMGPREVPRLWQRHVANCAVLAEVVPRDVRVADIGSGAGLPGVVLALARPDLRVTLIESLLRRTTFLEEVRGALDLDTITVLRARAEDLHDQQQRYDVVTARAVAPLPRLTRWGMPLVAPHGSLVAMKGASAADEVAEARPLLAELGCAPPEILVVGEGRQDVSPTHVVRVRWADPDRVAYDRPASSSRPARPSRRNGRGRSGRRRN